MRNMNERKYFGTDGIRGRVGEEPITAEFALRLGRALGAVLRRTDQRTRVLIGKDTRLSGYMLESALEAGLAASGADAVLLGPLPTPAVAYLTRSQRATAGIVISASHNPYEDNGIKLFSAAGEKLDDAVELAIEAELDAPSPSVSSRDLGKATRLLDAPGRYIEFLKSRLDSDLTALFGLHVIVDAAHGAAYRVAPRLFDELGLRVGSIGVNPNGFNINAGFGATDLTALRAEVLRTGAAIGLALDGDADRLMALTAEGRLVDGDDIVYVLARHWQARGVLRGPVVGTVMTNLGIELALRELGIGFERAAVGDRFVHQRLREVDGILGGEASGHVICCHKASTGDGLMTAILLLEVIAESGRTLAELVSDLHRFPQKTINVRVTRNAKALLQSEEIQATRVAVEHTLGDQGRLVLRASGTEPLIRVTVEARDAALVESQAGLLADIVRQTAAVVAEAESA
jgi:phosphoglucosamine mutase